MTLQMLYSGVPAGTNKLIMRETTRATSLTYESSFSATFMGSYFSKDGGLKGTEQIILYVDQIYCRKLPSNFDSFDFTNIIIYLIFPVFSKLQLLENTPQFSTKQCRK